MEKSTGWRLERMTNGKVHIKVIGCNRRLLDASRLAAYFKANGYEVINDPEKADINMLVSCSFKKQMEQVSLDALDKMKNHRGELIVAGCLPSIAPERLKESFNGRILPTKDLDSIDQLFPDFKVKFTDIPDANYKFSNCTKDAIITTNEWEAFKDNFQISSPFLRQSTEFVKKKINTWRGREALIRISHGCMGQCTYCGIRIASGKFRSKPIKKCLSEYRKLMSQGVRRIEFAGEDVGAYGSDTGGSFSELLREFSAIDQGLGTEWLVPELHPRWIIKYEKDFIEYAKAGKIKSLMVPVQSGSDRILKLMNRHHTSGEIVKALSSIKAANPGLELITQIIIGFPTETEEEFMETLKLVKKVGFGLVFVYPYYHVPDTPASRMEGQIPEKTVGERLLAAKKFLRDNKILIRCGEINSPDQDRKP